MISAIPRCLLLLLPLAALSAATAFSPDRAAVNDYCGMDYRREPVSFDVEVQPPAPIDRLGFNDDRVAQAEVLAGTRQAASRVRLWTLVDTHEHSHQILRFAHLPQALDHPTGLHVSPEGTRQVAGATVHLARISTGAFTALVPVAIADAAPFAAHHPTQLGHHHSRHVFTEAVSAFAVPAPLLAIAAEDQPWTGRGHLDVLRRVTALEITVDSGPVFIEVRLDYSFEDDRSYQARLRFTPGKTHVAIDEDFNLGGNARFVFDLGDFPAHWTLAPGDQRLIHWEPAATHQVHDFIRIPGQRCLARMVVWSQFNYFGGKQETLALMDEDRRLAVGAFYRRPDLWTRAKVNHVDLYARPQLPEDPQSRGVTGLEGAEERLAMEAWLVDGHRRWAVFARPPGSWSEDDEGQRQFTTDAYVAKAHITEGVWYFDRLNRLPLVWNPDGSPIVPEDTAPAGSMAFGGDINNVLKGTRIRAGLQVFNGSNQNMRRSVPNAAAGYARWASEHQATTAAELHAAGQTNQRLVGPALWAYMAMDDSAYPGTRAMLPWSHPEALNPFYQGMENQNFNADRYRCVSALGVGLSRLNHPEGQSILAYGAQQMDMALDAYVYPGSGCWEESHTYAAHTMINLLPLARDLRDNGERNFFADLRFARMFAFWVHAHSPRDQRFGGIRIPPPVGDHGVSPNNFVRQITDALPHFAAVDDPEIQAIVGHLAWLLTEKDAPVPDGISPVAPPLDSRFLHGYGASMRAIDPAGRESYLLLRAGQSWGHHHMDKGAIWFWGRNVPFIVNAAWGSPPGGNYGNDYKQGPAGRTQLEFLGVNNWTLPAKYPAPWISDDHYHPAVDYANARCLFPYNPALDLARSSPLVRRNGYDRQVLFLRPDVFVVRDNLETACQTIWRFHSTQIDDLRWADNRADMTSGALGVHGHLHLAWPTPVSFQHIDRDDLNQNSLGQPFGHAKGAEMGGRRNRIAQHDTRTALLRWDMPLNNSATWVFGVRADDEPDLTVTVLDDQGRVLRIALPDGRHATTFLNIEDFTWSDDQHHFDGTVGVIYHHPDGRHEPHLIRGRELR